MKPLPHRLGLALLPISVLMACISAPQAATNLSGRYVIETEDGWRLPALGEDISFSVFYPSWFVGAGIGVVRLRDIDNCDLRSVDIGNHFAPRWRWHLGGAQCELDSQSEQNFDVANVRVEHLLGDVEDTFNTFVGAGLLTRRYDGELTFEDAEDVAVRVNLGVQARSEGRWAVRLDHTQSSESYEQTSLSLVAYLGGANVADSPATAVLTGDSSTVDSQAYLTAAPEPTDVDSDEDVVPVPSEAEEVVVVDAAPLDELPATDITAGTPTEAVAADATDRVEPAATVVVASAEETDTAAAAIAPSAVAEVRAPAEVATEITANVCPPIARPLKSLAFSASGELEAQSVDQLRALAGTLARRDNLIGRVALPDDLGAAVAADNVLDTMLQAEPLIDGRLVAEVIPNLTTPIFELYRVKVGC